MTKVLILCTGNSCRSQMAEGWLKYFSQNTIIYSAGTHPEAVNKHAIHVMKDAGIDISNNTSNNVIDYIDIDLDYVITVCDNAKNACPTFSENVNRIHWSIDDPFKNWNFDLDQLSTFRETREEIKSRLLKFIQEYKIGK